MNEEKTQAKVIDSFIEFLKFIGSVVKTMVVEFFHVLMEVFKEIKQK